MRLLLAVTALASAHWLCAAEPGPKSHFDLRAEAQAAYQRKDYAAARQAFAAALELRPDSPRYLHNLAAVAALMGDEAAALDYLRRLAALGVVTPVERDPDFATLQGKPEFRKILAQLAENAAPHGEVDLVAELPGRTGIIEGIAFRGRTGDLFLGDAHQRCIWRRDRTGQISRYTEDDEELLGVFGLQIDEARHTLWAATSALPEMAGFTPALKGRAALAEFDLRTSELRRVIPVPGDGRDHALGDLLVAPDGTVYATDSLAPIIWQLPAGAEDMMKLIESPQFVSLQGLVLSGKTLVVADYANGLFAVTLAGEPTARALAAPKGTTLLGLDGLVAVPDGVVGVQNGVTPQRVVRIGLAPDLGSVTGVTVLAAALSNFTDLALITMINDRPTLVAGAGWDLFDAAKAKQPPAHTVRIVQAALP